MRFSCVALVISLYNHDITGRHLQCPINRNICTKQRLHGGLNNKLWKVCHTEHPDDAIIIRILGAVGNKFYDRDREFKILKELNREEVIAPVYCRYLYKYMPQCQIQGESIKVSFVNKGAHVFAVKSNNI